ncbi:MAG: transposase [Methylorubrum populi]
MVLQAGLDEVARFLERADPPSRQDATPVRRALAGIAWHLRTGGGWRALPAGFPPWRTVYGWFRRWIEKGLFESLMRALARRQRRRCGRRPEPRLAIIDTQSIKCLGVRGPRGYDGAKKLVGRKRVALVDAEGCTGPSPAADNAGRPSRSLAACARHVPGSGLQATHGRRHVAASR